MAHTTADRRRIWLVGPGFHFLGGLSVYTCRLAGALAADHDVSVVLLRRLIPERLYPGGARAGQDLTSLSYPDDVSIAGELDWWWGPEIRRVTARLRRERPDVLVLQWWTAATLHTYLVLAVAARRAGVPVVVEFHETQDPGEAGVALAGAIARHGVPRLLALASGALVHNDHDLALLRHTYGAALDRPAIATAPHGPYDHLPVGPVDVPSEAELAEPTIGTAGPTRLLFFGLIRPYKGLEDLIEAYAGLTAEEAADVSLTVVGETWEGWTRPAELIAECPHPVTFVNRYVSDGEAAEHFAAADAVVLPYRRGSASGPLQIAMSLGLHAVLYRVGGLVEAVRDYAGAVLVEPGDVDALRRALLDLRARRAERFTDPHSWGRTVAALDDLTDRVSGPTHAPRKDLVAP